MFCSRIAFAATFLTLSPMLFAQTAPLSQPPLQAIKNIYILNIGKPTILSVVDTDNTTHKLSIPLNKDELTCKALTKITKRHNLLMRKSSVVYLADSRKIHTFTPCRKSQGATH